MNRTKIEWATHTWNPMTGCTVGCKYCYARKITKRFPLNYPHGFLPVFDPRECAVRMPKSSARIFTVSMGDFWDPAFNEEDRAKVLLRIRTNPQHRYLILTKRPENICEPKIAGTIIRFPSNLWLGVTVDQRGTEGRINTLLGVVGGPEHAFVSFEPILDYLDLSKVEMNGLEWAIIGAQTNPNKLPPWETVEDIIDKCRIWKIPYFVKNNIHPLFVNYRREDQFKQEYQIELRLTN